MALIPTRERASAIAINPARPQIAWAEVNTVQLFDVSTDEKHPSFSAAGEPLEMQFSDDGQLIALLMRGAVVRGISVWNAQAREKTFDFLEEGQKQPPLISVDRILAFDRESRLWCLVTVNKKPAERQVVRYTSDGTSWETMLTLSRSAGVRLSRDLSLAAVTPGPAEDKSETIEVWDLKSREVIKHLDGHWNHVEQLAFSPDNKWLASTARNGGVIKIWSLEN